MTDPITDMFNRIRNAGAVSHQTVSIPFSSFKHEIAKILKKEDFVEKVETKGRQPRRFILITLKYNEDKSHVIQMLKRISKPGQRIYLPAADIRPARKGYGMTIISTPKGVMTNREARKKNLGGEVICEAW